MQSIQVTIAFSHPKSKDLKSDTYKINRLVLARDSLTSTSWLSWADSIHFDLPAQLK